MKVLPVLILVVLTLIIILMDHEQLKLLAYSIQPFNYIKKESVPFKKRKIAIITAEDRDYPYVQYHDLNFKKYSDTHGYSYFRLDNCPKEVSTTYWCKIHKVKEFLDSGEYDYIMWADSDTIIPDVNKSLDQFISDIGEPDIIIGEYQSILYLTNNYYCAGLFLVKSSEIGKSFINDCLSKIKSKSGCIINGKEQGFWAGICYEQGVMNLLIREKYKDYTYIDTKEELILNSMGEKYNKQSEATVVHLAGYPNNAREEFFKQYI